MNETKPLSSRNRHREAVMRAMADFKHNAEAMICAIHALGSAEHQNADTDVPDEAVSNATEAFDELVFDWSSIRNAWTRKEDRTTDDLFVSFEPQTEKD